MEETPVFFKLLFGSAQGYICIASLRKGSFSEHFFQYPDELEELSSFVDNRAPTHNVYFCAQLLSSKTRTKETVQTCTTAWADLDTCDPDNLLVKPSVVIESSPGRWQGYWVFDEPVDPPEAESLCKRIAYYHAYQGCDRSGWDLTQLLRVPFTLNHKYTPAERVVIQDATRARYRLGDFEKYPSVVNEQAEDFPFPDKLDFTAQDVLERYAEQLPVHTKDYFEKEPTGDWSKSLWALEMLCLEAGMSREEVYVVCSASACNKYLRDGKDPKNLWIEVCKAHVRNEENKRLLRPDPEPVTALLTQAERESLSSAPETFVDRYIRWASTLGDAAPQYHQAGAFIILSSILAGRLHLPTSFGTIKPNVWFMLLADTTLTRKSTAMDIAMDLLMEVDSAPLLATDGSVEGLMQGLSVRPGQASVFLRDEFSGFLEQMVKRDYYAGMAETLTKLYDGKIQKRMLRKETIEIKDPTFLVFAGGIKNRVCALLTHELVSSGFIPRFVFITAESDTSRIQAMGPPQAQDLSVRNALIEELRNLLESYQMVPSHMIVGGTGKATHVRMDHGPARKAELSPEAWDRYNQLERNMMQIALRTDSADLMTPTYDRLCKTGLRIAVLIAGSENPEDEIVRVESWHVLRAIAYVEKWKQYTDEVLSKVGKTAYEGLIDKILHMIQRAPGATRSEIMRNYHLTSRDANLLFQTLEERGLIVSRKVGKATVYNPAGGNP